jgi:putative transposase
MADVCCKHGVSSATFYRWKARYRGLGVSDARRLRSLKDENAKLKRAVGRSDAGQRHVERHRLKKMVTPVARREAVARLRQTYEASHRRACRVIGANTLY